MIAVWIVGFLFLAVGLLVCVPRYVRFAKCKGRTKGVMTRVQSGSGIFRLGGECDVCYNVRKPRQSYLKWTGQIMNCVIGTIFALAGLGVLGCGLLLMQIL